MLVIHLKSTGDLFQQSLTPPNRYAISNKSRISPNQVQEVIQGISTQAQDFVEDPTQTQATILDQFPSLDPAGVQVWIEQIEYASGGVSKPMVDSITLALHRVDLLPQDLYSPEELKEVLYEM